MTFDVIVIGAGAAGLMCAVEAGKRGRRVAILERNDRAGRKIQISGGGRCNFTNLHTTPENFITSNPRFHKSALARYRPADFIRWLERHHIPYHEKKLGQLFCDRSSDDILEMLLRECSEAGVQILTGIAISEIRKSGIFALASNQGDFYCHSLVIASGGLSIPALGATSFGYDIARQFGLQLVAPRPALVPLTFDGVEGRLFGSLTGVSLDVEVRCGDGVFRENMLFTHRGLSGPAVLQASSYWTPGDGIVLNVLPDHEFKRRPGIELRPLLQEYLPKRFVQEWCEVYAPAKPLAQYSRKELDDIGLRLHAWKLTPSGSEGYKKAEVTAGGIDTRELSSKTMECLKVSGLYFIGEVVDVTGQLGGFNFQWAWSSGFAAGQFV